jgi:hypothetical protein
MRKLIVANIISVEEISIGLLREPVAWTKFANRDAFIAAIQKTMADPRHLRAYKATDATRSQDEVATFAGVSQPTVYRLRTRWRRLGLVEISNGRAAHLARPSDLGVEIPDGPRN